MLLRDLFIKKNKRFEGANVLKGREDDVRYLIYYAIDERMGEVVIFVDDDLDLDWEADGEISRLLVQEPLRAASTSIISGIAALEPIVHNWPSDLKLSAKRTMGEALTCIFLNDPKGAAEALQNAKLLVKAKSREVSRYWTLQACLVFGGVAASAGLFEILIREHVIAHLGIITFLLTLCFWSGCVGALFFVLMGLGRQPRVDSSAERNLHYLEALARIVGGGIAGILIGGLVKLGLILPVFGRVGTEVMAMCAAAMIAGASERLAAGIITTIENHQTTKEGENHADN